VEFLFDGHLVRVRHLGCFVFLLGFSLNLRLSLLLSLLGFFFLIFFLGRIILLILRFRLVFFGVFFFVIRLLASLFISFGLLLCLKFFLFFLFVCGLLFLIYLGNDLFNHSLSNFSRDLDELEDVRAVQLKAQRHLGLSGVLLDRDGVVSDFCELIQSISSEQFSFFFTSGIGLDSFYLDLHCFVITELDSLLLSEIVLLVLVKHDLLFV